MQTFVCVKQRFKMYKDKLNSPDDVKKYYNEWSDRMIEMGGMAFQASRTTNVDDMFDYFISTIGIQENQSVLEGGCGVGGPLQGLAKKIAANFTGITISPYQITLANNFLDENKSHLKGSIKFVEGDYHNLTSYFAEKSFDHIMFLEALGHSNNPKKVIEGVYTVLKEGGSLYIKDCFCKLSADPIIQQQIDEQIKITNENYCYNTLEVSELLDILRRTGFELIHLRPPQYKNDPTEANAFVKRHNIQKRTIKSMDLYEIKCVKPVNQVG